MKQKNKKYIVPQTNSLPTYICVNFMENIVQSLTKGIPGVTQGEVGSKERITDSEENVCWGNIW